MDMFLKNLGPNLPLLVIAFLAVIFLAIYFRSVKTGKGLEYIYNLFEQKLTRDRFYEITRLVIVLLFWLAVVVVVSLVSNSILISVAQLKAVPVEEYYTPSPVVTSTMTLTSTVTPLPTDTQTPAPPTQTPTLFVPTPTLPFAPARQDEILLIIAPFDGNGSTKPESWIEKRLLEELKNSSEPVKVRIERYPQPIPQHDQQNLLAQVKQTYKPALLVWGWYDDLGVTANFYVAQNSFVYSHYHPATLSEALRLPSQEDTFVFYVTRDLPKEVIHLTYFLVSEIKFTSGDYQSALSYAQKALDNLPEKRDTPKHDLMHLIAVNHLLANDDFESAIRITSEVLLEDPDHFNSLGVRGVAYQLKALKDYIRVNHINYTVSFVQQGTEYLYQISSDQEIPLTAFKSVEARQDFIHLIKLDPMPEEYYLLGMEEYAFGNTSEAIADMQKVISMKQEGSFLRNLAQNYLDMWLPTRTPTP
jgi:tetratricopeptide (TPR) repeat protein